MQLLNILKPNNFLQGHNARLYTLLLLLVYIPYLLYNIIPLRIRPDLLLITIFYFSIIKKCRINYLYLILLGLLNDDLTNTALGSGALIYTLVSIIARANSTALFKQKFSIVLGAFTAAILVAFILKVCIAFIVNGQLEVSYYDCMGVVATVLTYPLIHYIYTAKLPWFMQYISYK